MYVFRIEGFGHGFEARDEDDAARVAAGGGGCEERDELVGEHVVPEDVGGEDEAQVWEVLLPFFPMAVVLRGGKGASVADLIGCCAGGRIHKVRQHAPDRFAPCDSRDIANAGIADDAVEVGDRAIEELCGEGADRA